MTKVAAEPFFFYGPEDLPRAIRHLATLKAWIFWRWGEPAKKGGTKPAKRPVDAAGNFGSYAASDIGDTYGKLHWIATTLRKPEFFDGVGITAHGVQIEREAGNPAANMIMIDLDGCVDKDTGAVAPWAMFIVENSQSYTELSPSRTGLRIIGGAGKHWDPKERQRHWYYGPSEDRMLGKGESYYSSGWCTITFQMMDGYKDLWNPELDFVAANCLPRRNNAYAGQKINFENVNQDPRAPIEVIRETLEMLPNDEPNTSWKFWLRVMFAIFRASEGSADGKKAWLGWSESYVHGIDDPTDDADDHWDHLWASPPHSGGHHSILGMARDKQAKLGNTTWQGGQQWQAWRAAWRGAWRGAAMTPLASTAAVAVSPSQAMEEAGNGLSGSGEMSDAVSLGMSPPDLPGSPGYVPPEVRPRVILNGINPATRMRFELPEIIDHIETTMLATNVEIYQRAGKLMRPGGFTQREKDGRTTYSAGFHPVVADTLRDMLPRSMTFWRWDGTGKDAELIHVNLPKKDICDLFMTRAGTWRMRPVRTIAMTPVLRADGTLLATPGYDPATGIFMKPNPSLDFEAIEAAVGTPSGLDAHYAMEKLNRLVDDFPFVDDRVDPATGFRFGPDRSVAVSGLLTPFVRHLMKAAPVHAFAAPEGGAGTGKTYLVELAGALAYGRQPSVIPGRDKEEMDKCLVAAMLKGNPLIIADNLTGEIQSTLMNAAITGGRFELRIMTTHNQPEMENDFTWFITGNNIRPIRDNVRRMLMCTLDAHTDSPETRRFPRPTPFDRIIAHHQDYIVAVLTVLRAHALAGYPGDIRLANHPFNGFEDWTRLVRGPLVWLGHADPCDTIERTRREDPSRSDFAEFCHLMWSMFGLGEDGSRTMKEIEAVGVGNCSQWSNKRLDQATELALSTRLHDLLVRMFPNRIEGYDKKAFQYWLRSRKNSTSSGMLKLVQSKKEDHGTAKWMVISELVVHDGGEALIQAVKRGG